MNKLSYCKYCKLPKHQCQCTSGEWTADYKQINIPLVPYEQFYKLQTFNNRIILLQNCLKQAQESIRNSPNDTSYCSPNFEIDGIVRDIESIQEELRVLSYIQPYL